MPDSDCVLLETKSLDRILALLRWTKSHDARDGLTERLVSLEQEIEESYLKSKTMKSKNTTLDSSLETELDSSRSTIFWASMRIFFERALYSLSGTSERLSNILDNTFQLLEFNLRNKKCRALRRIPPLSLFLIGVDARDDYERKIVLDLINYFAVEAESWAQADGQASPAVGFRTTGMNHAMDLLKKVWVIDDLQGKAEGVSQYFGYRGKLCQVLSSSTTLPCLL